MKGIFVNTKKANCSIHSSGKMIYEVINGSADYSLDYIEIDQLDIDSLHNGIIYSSVHTVQSSYDFYIFNYHHYTMRAMHRVDSGRFVKLSGKKFCIILEMTKNDPFSFLQPVGFDHIIVLDPTMVRPETNIHAFPRPLLSFNKPQIFQTLPEQPLIGSFGYATIDKGFDLIVKAAALEFEKAHVRINLSPSTYADPAMGENFRLQIEQDCRSYLRPGITIEFTRHYFSDQDLVNWCAENTLNCFFYTRNIPGLAAATDQAIMSGAPLAVGSNTTFRHIHQYIRPYPEISLKESIMTSHVGLEQISQNWSKLACQTKFKQILFL